MNREVTVGSTWLHFKGTHIAVIIALATHTETGEQLVVYDCFDDTTKTSQGIFARPLSMFLSEVDKQKYPDVMQKYRFERVN